MKSIRLSLIVYFLVLLAVALGAVSFLLYRTTAQAMQEKQAINRQLLGERYKAEKEEERRKLKDELYSHARTIATLAQSPETKSFSPDSCQPSSSHRVAPSW